VNQLAYLLLLLLLASRSCRHTSPSKQPEIDHFLGSAFAYWAECTTPLDTKHTTTLLPRPLPSFGDTMRTEPIPGGDIWNAIANLVHSNVAAIAKEYFITVIV
jgi:hypothetical protein